MADVECIIKTVDVSELKQQWIGFHQPELKQVEELALLALLHTLDFCSERG